MRSEQLALELDSQEVEEDGQEGVDNEDLQCGLYSKLDHKKGVKELLVLCDDMMIVLEYDSITQQDPSLAENVEREEGYLDNPCSSLFLLKFLG